MGKGHDIMNPLNWRREHQVALLLGGTIGIAMGLVVGYMFDSFWGMFAVLATSGSSGPPKMVDTWLASGSSLRWGVFGALFGGAVIYTRQLLHA